MKKRFPALLLVLVMVLSLMSPAAMADGPKVSIGEQYLFKGTVAQSWCYTASRSSPVVTDLDGDGKLEVLNAAYNLHVMDAATGAEKWRASSNAMVFCDFKVLDIDADGSKEIVIGYSDGTLSVLNNQGSVKWQRQHVDEYGYNSSISSLAVDDLDLDGKMEIIVGLATSSAKSVWVYRCDGTVANGWPQLSDSQNGVLQSSFADRSKTAYSAGIFGNGITTGDLNGDGKPEIIVPTDTAYINAYCYDGSLVKASDIYSDANGSRMWGKIALWEDYNEEIAHKNEGWGMPNEVDGTRLHTYRGELGAAGTVYTDVDGNGTSEVVVTAMMIDRTTFDTLGNNVATLADARYMTVLILNQDRSRYVNSSLGFDWTTIPNELNSQIGLHIKPDDASSMSANVFPVPVCSDLDGDGYQEILFNSFDGKLHCFSLDKSEWSFTLPKSSGSTYEYATPPVCKDLDGDGKEEVIFASWLDTAATGRTGALYVLNYKGELLAQKDLHAAYNASLNNGVQGSPIVADIDNDGKYEVLLNTTNYGLCAYELTVESTGTPTTPSTPSTPDTPSTPSSTKAGVSRQNLSVDGNDVDCEKYNIEGYNYFKLRDLACLVSGTDAQFDVGSSGSRVIITTGQPYALASDGPGKSTNESATAKPSTQTIIIDGVEYDLTAYNIHGYNFFQLRDLGPLLGFEVGYEGSTNTATVATK